MAVANSGDVGYCLAASAQQSLDAETETETLIATPTGDVAHALRAEGFDASEDGTGRGTPVVAFAHQAGGKQTSLGFDDSGSVQTLSTNQTPAIAFAENSRAELRLCGGDGQVSAQLTTGGGKPGQGSPAIIQEWAVRRLTPVECERLQGFPDGFTDVPWRGKNTSPDGRRYKALGNSMAVNVMRWLGDRIQLVDAIDE